MIVNDNFGLRLIDESDLDFLLNLREDPSTNEYLGTFCLLNKALQKEWFERVIHDSSKKYMIFEQREKDTVLKLGMVRFTDIDTINRSMCVGGDIIPEFRGKGYATEMYRLIFKLGFDCLNAVRLWLLVLDDNDRARYLYEKVGFSYEGTLRSAVFKEGIYHDYLMMSILEKEYRKNGK